MKTYGTYDLPADDTELWTEEDERMPKRAKEPVVLPQEEYDSHISQLATALIAAQADFPPVKKTRTANVGKFKYQYADLSDVLAVCGTVLRKHGLLLTQRFSLDGGTILLETMLVHVSGELISSILPLCGPGPTAQEVGSLMTYMRRYAITALLGIAAEEDDDGAAGNDATPMRAEPKPAEPSSLLATSKQTKMIFARAVEKADGLGLTREDAVERLRNLCGRLGFASRSDITIGAVNTILAEIEKWTIDGDEMAEVPF